MNGVILVVFLVLAFVSFLFVALSVLCMFKVFQIAEDLRYLRSRTDLKVERPKPFMNDISICFIVAGVLTFLVLAFIMTGGFKVFGL